MINCFFVAILFPVFSLRVFPAITHTHAHWYINLPPTDARLHAQISSRNFLRFLNTRFSAATTTPNLLVKPRAYDLLLFLAVNHARALLRGHK